MESVYVSIVADTVNAVIKARSEVSDVEIEPAATARARVLTVIAVYRSTDNHSNH
jgi:hypothetical protein